MKTVYPLQTKFAGGIKTKQEQTIKRIQFSQHAKSKSDNCYSLLYFLYLDKSFLV